MWFSFSDFQGKSEGTLVLNLQIILKEAKYLMIIEPLSN